MGLKAVTVNRPLWIGNIAPRIKEFMESVSTPGITYENLYTYFCNTAQNAEIMTPVNMLPNTEFKVVMDDKEALGFGHWFVRGLPYISTSYMDYIHSWSKDKRVAELLIDSFIEFSELRNCEILRGAAFDKARYRYFRLMCRKKGFELSTENMISCIARRR